MKLTPELERAMGYLKEQKRLYKSNSSATPHCFVPEYRIDEKDPWRGWECINRQTINKMILLGYACYFDKKKTIVDYVDKDAHMAELYRRADIGSALLRIFRAGGEIKIDGVVIVSEDDLRLYRRESNA